MERGSLPRTDEHKIQVNFSYLVKELDVKYIIRDLFEQMLIDINEKEEIGSISRFDDRADKFLNYLLRSGGSDGYQKFLDCLRKNQYGHIVDKLESTEPEPAYDTEPCPWFDSVDERIKQHVILDVDASRFSLCIGNGWENLLRELGIGQADIEMEKQSTRDAVSCLCRLLIRWKQRKSKAATVQALVQAMKELDGSLTVDWEKFHKAVGKISI